MALSPHRRRLVRGTRSPGPGESRKVRNQSGRGRTSPVHERPFQRLTRPGWLGSGYQAGGWERVTTRSCSSRGVPFAPVGALVVLAAEAGAIEPGTEAETVVLVRNTGESTDAFHVAVRGAAASWASIDPQSVTLEAGEEAPVWVRFRPPRSPATLPGPVPYSVVVASREHPDFTAVELGVLHVGTFASVELTPAGESSFGLRGSELIYEVRNTGNRRVKVSLHAEAAGRGVGVEVEPDDVDLRPGGETDVTVRVVTPRFVLPWRPVDRGLTISAASDGGALATVRTEYPDEPSLHQELLRSVRVLGVVLVLLVIGGLALLQSDDDSSEVNVRLDPRATTTTVAGGVAAAGGSAPTSPPTTAPPSLPPLPKLVFVRTYDPNVKDVVVRQAGARGTELRLRSDTADETQPHLSPDGASIAFVREHEATWRVCVISVSGGEAVCVAETTATASVAWAADGRSLFFSRGNQLFSVTYDRTTQTQGTEVDTGVEVPGGGFALSRDGTRVVVAEGRRLLVRPVNGSPGLSIDVPGVAEDPSWSPDGSRIVFSSNYQLFTAPVGAGPIRQVTADGTVNGDPTWTADGDWIVFRSNRSGGGDLYAVKGSSANGAETGLVQVTATPQRETSPAF